MLSHFAIRLSEVDQLTAHALPPTHLCQDPAPAYRLDGSVRDLSTPMVEEVDFYEVACALSRIARFNGAMGGAAYSVAQHSVLGTEAILKETGDTFLASLFLLHDGHEFVLGDQTKPQQSLFDGMIGGETFSRMRAIAASAWDDVIYRAAGLPEPSVWQPKWRNAVKAMDHRMAITEANDLTGTDAAYRRGYEPVKRPAFKGVITPWPAIKAELVFIEMAERLIGRETMVSAASVHAAHRTTFPNIARSS